MPNNGYIIYVDMLQLWIYLLFSYTTCEWSESEFHNIKKVLLCSILFSLVSWCTCKRYLLLLDYYTRVISSQIEYYNVVQCGVVLEIHENNKKVTHFVMRFFDMDQL